MALHEGPTGFTSWNQILDEFYGEFQVDRVLKGFYEFFFSWFQASPKPGKSSLSDYSSINGVLVKPGKNPVKPSQTR